MVRLFVAAWPSAEVAERLGELPRFDEVGVRPVVPANWHITLRFLGEAEPDEVAARLGDAPLPSASIDLGPRVERLGPGQLVIPVTGADELAAAVREATADLGQPDQHRFAGHLTVSRTKHDARSDLFGQPFHAAMTVREVALVESILDPTGAIYTTLATFPTT
jgi:2'-5' RNA ligase